MSDSPVEGNAQMAPGDSNPTTSEKCNALKLKLDKCVKEKGEEACKDILDAYKACLKSSTEKA